MNARLTSVILRVLLLAWPFAVLLILPAHVFAATLNVTDLGDSGAPGQLRTLINAAAPGDTIVIPAGTITLTGTPNENANAGGDLDIAKSLTIQGAGPGATIIDGGAIDRVMTIINGTGAVTIYNMTIRNGAAIGSFGGGILSGSANTLTLSNVTISGNRATFGGGISNLTSTSTLTLTNATISDNTVSGISGGGGIDNSGTATLTNVTLSGNNGGSTGGGIRTGPNSTLTLTNVTLSGNRAGFPGGGGIANSGGTATLTNVALSDNTSVISGGGILNSAGSTLALTNVTLSGNKGDLGGALNNNNGTATLTNVTISGNTPFSTGNGGITNGGNLTLTNVTISGNVANGGLTGSGISNIGSGTATLTNVLLSGNTAAAGGSNCSGTITSLGNNLDSGATCAFASPGDLSNTDPLLGPLQSNGGPTQTHALLPGSSAINAGTNSGCPSTDQRGFARPQGATCDIGAFEFGVIVAAVQLNGSVFHTGQEIIYEATLNPSFTPTQVDIYLGALLPDGATFLSLVQAGGGAISIALGPSPVPFLENQTLGPLKVEFEFTFGGPEPIGTYFPYAGLAVAGSNPFIAANQLSVAVQSFQYSP